MVICRENELHVILPIRKSPFKIARGQGRYVFTDSRPCSNPEKEHFSDAVPDKDTYTTHFHYLFLSLDSIPPAVLTREYSERALRHAGFESQI